MSNKKENSNNLPYLIIGGVAVLAILGLFYFLKFREPDRKPGTNSASKTTSAPISAALAKAPAGAVPPNSLGSPTASVVLEEFADYQCPTCATVHPYIKEVIAAYGSKIRFVFRSFPLTQIHDKAYDAAVVAEAAGMQGKFWDMQNQLFQNQKAWSAQGADHKTLFNDYAKLIGLDIEKFKNDIAGLAAKSRVDADLTRGRAAQLTGTPSLFVNGMLVPFEQMNVQGLKQIVDAELQKFQAPPAEGANTAK